MSDRDRTPGRHEPSQDAPREAQPAPQPPPRPHPEPAEVPELLGERSDYPVPRGEE